MKIFTTSTLVLGLIVWYTKDILTKTYIVYVTDGLYTHHQLFIDTWVLIASLIVLLVLLVSSISLIVEKLIKNKQEH